MGITGLGSSGFLIIGIVMLILPIWATVVTLRRNDFSLTNKILLIAFSWVIVFTGPVGLIGPILTLVIIYFNKPTEHNGSEY